ncbi:tetratricopeptide repeat protein [Myxococcota bacterium]|nr:tetratricopeptide repeat protein [Myxococcota bacterium]
MFCGFAGATLSQANEESAAIANETLPVAAEVVVEEESADVAISPSSEAEVAYRAAMEAGQKGDFPLARELMEKSLRLQPDYGKADLALGVILMVLGEREEGTARLQRLAALPLPIAAQAHTLLANEASKEARYEDVAKHYAQAIEITPDDFLLHVKLGKSLLAQGRFQEAIPVLEAAIVLQPEAPIGWLNLGRAYLNVDRASDAELGFRRALEFDPRNLHANWYLARVLASQGDKEQSHALYEKAAKLAEQRGQKEWLIRIRAEQQSL